MVLSGSLSSRVVGFPSRKKTPTPTYCSMTKEVSGTVDPVFQIHVVLFSLTDVPGHPLNLVISL